MRLTSVETAQLKKIISLAEALLEKAETGEKVRKSKGEDNQARIRRSGKELASFRKMLKSERKAGVPVADLAKKHGISPSYIYQLG